MVSVDIEAEWASGIGLAVTEHGGLILSVETDDSEGMTGGRITVTFPDAKQAIGQLSDAIHSLARRT